jgi:hypothetical protein
MFVAVPAKRPVFGAKASTDSQKLAVSSPLLRQNYARRCTHSTPLVRSWAICSGSTQT